MSASEDVFDRIRAAAAEVAQQAKFVRLVDAQIAPYAASLAASGLPTPVYDTAHHARGSVAETVAFLLALDTVNFGSGYFPHLRKRPGMSGYFTVASSLKERWERDGPLTGDRAASDRRQRLRSPLRAGREHGTGAGADGALCPGAQRSRRVVGRTL